MQAQDIMTQFVVSVRPDDSLATAIDLMVKNDVSGLPVLGPEGALLGMLTEGDLLRRVETATRRQRPRWLELLLGPGRLADDYVHAHSRKVGDLMTPWPYSVDEDTPLEQVVTLMEKRRIKRIPVVRNGKVVGIISRANLVQALARVASEVAPADSDDRAIRAHIMATLERERWAPLAAVQVIVRGGVVDLWGTLSDERMRRALIVAVENTPGVREVRDHMAWIEPLSGETVLAPSAPAQRSAEGTVLP